MAGTLSCSHYVLPIDNDAFIIIQLKAQLLHETFKD